MKYLYYPGCSLEKTAVEYNMSTKALMEALDIELVEIDDWSCCGATAAEAVSSMLSLTLSARNLALAEKMMPHGTILVPCSACYLNLKRVEIKIREDPSLLDAINAILISENLVLKGTVKVRHLLDILISDVGPAVIGENVAHPFSGVSIAPYYGCQCLRPYALFDDPESPQSMTPLIEATHASTIPWKMGGKCCGASHMNTKMDVGLKLVGAILKDAKNADAIVTVCPMCQLNLEAYQRKVSKLNGTTCHISILYLPQLLGLSLGLDERSVGLNLNLSITDEFLRKSKLARPGLMKICLFS